jgi:hypothetical protein
VHNAASTHLLVSDRNGSSMQQQQHSAAAAFSSSSSSTAAAVPHLHDAVECHIIARQVGAHNVLHQVL